jgi:hypothetical protein
MATVRDVCFHVRSKNAGPFWVCIDLFFNGRENFVKYRDSKALAPSVIASFYGVNPELVKWFPVENLNMVKLAFPRTSPQGGITERDMHCGQQFVRLLDVELD